MACLFTPGWLPLLALADRWIPAGNPLKRVTSTIYTFGSMMVASLVALRVFFVDPQSMWIVTSAKKELEH